MNVRLEIYDPQEHDRHRIAELIMQSDPEMNRLVYGERPVEVIKELLSIPESYFTPDYTKLAVLDDTLAGVVVYYPAAERQAVDKRAGQGLMKAMGLFGFLRKFPLYNKMGKMLGGEIEDDGLYIHTLAVNSDLRGRGIGSEIIRALSRENETMYAYVNAANDRAIRFYKRNGFEEASYGEMRHKGQKYGEYLMERRGSPT